MAGNRRLFPWMDHLSPDQLEGMKRRSHDWFESGKINSLFVLCDDFSKANIDVPDVKKGFWDAARSGLSSLFSLKHTPALDTDVPDAFQIANPLMGG